MGGVDLQVEIFWCFIVPKQVIVIVELPLLAVWSSVESLITKLTVGIEGDSTVCPVAILVMITCSPCVSDFESSDVSVLIELGLKVANVSVGVIEVEPTI